MLSRRWSGHPSLCRPPAVHRLRVQPGRRYEARHCRKPPRSSRHDQLIPSSPQHSPSTTDAARAKTNKSQRDAALPNPDPQPDSPSARMVAEHEPYMVATYARPPPVFVRGEGSYLWDFENRRYLDFTAGIAVNGLGHCDPEFSKLIAQQV